MVCKGCGNVLENDETFCPRCGKPNDEGNKHNLNQRLYRLLPNSERSYSITVNRDNVLFSGTYWYLKDKEFVKCQNGQETALIQNYLGIGYLEKRSPKKCIWFVLVGTVLELIKMVIDKLTEWVDEANNYLQWFDRTISLPDWLNYTMNTVAVVCIIMAIIFFFSKKKVIEISFTDRRICVPQKSMTRDEYNALYRSIQIAKDDK